MTNRWPIDIHTYMFTLLSPPRFMEIKIQTGSTEENVAVAWATCPVTWCLRSRWTMRRPGSSYCSRASCPQRALWRRSVGETVWLKTKTNGYIRVCLWFTVQTKWKYTYFCLLKLSIFCHRFKTVTFFSCNHCYSCLSGKWKWQHKCSRIQT